MKILGNSCTFSLRTTGRHVTTCLCLLFACISVLGQQSPLLSFETESGASKEVRNTRDWSIKRKQILDGMQEAMGKLPERNGLPALAIEFRDSVHQASYIRYNIHFTAAENERVPALLYLPKPTDNRMKHAAMLVLHGTGDAGKELVDGKSPRANRALAKELAERGYVVIAPDYPSMGELKDYDFATDRYESATMKGIFNHMRCVDLLQTLPQVDPDRIGVIGHSLGGHNAMFVGAFDERLKVIVSSCGWTLMDYYNIGEEGSRRYGGRLGPWAQDRYMPLLREKYNLDGDLFPFDFDGVIAALAPRHFFSNSPVDDSNFDVAGVREGIASAMKVYKLFESENNLRVCYPKAGHDFPVDIRLSAYRFIDTVLDHKPTKHTVE